MMHANILQYQFYLEKHGRLRDLNRIILLTPNEGRASENFSGRAGPEATRCIQREDILEVKACWAACEVILEAQEHLIVKAYLKAHNFVEEQQKRAKAEDDPRSLPIKSRNAKVVPAVGRKPDESHVPDVMETVQRMKDEVARDENENAATKQQDRLSNIIYLPFMTPEVRACAKACGMGVEAYVKQVIQFANEAVKNEQARNIILNRQA